MEHLHQWQAQGSCCPLFPSPPSLLENSRMGDGRSIISCLSHCLLTFPQTHSASPAVSLCTSCFRCQECIAPGVHRANSFPLLQGFAQTSLLLEAYNDHPVTAAPTLSSSGFLIPLNSASLFLISFPTFESTLHLLIYYDYCLCIPPPTGRWAPTGPGFLCLRVVDVSQVLQQ